MNDLAKEMADIERRLLGLKAERPVDVSQIQFLQDQYPFSFSLVKRPDPGWVATFEVVTVCGGDPLVDVGVDGLPTGSVIVVPTIVHALAANTVTSTVYVFNDNLVSGVSLNITIGVYALNGLSSTCIRTS